MFQLFDLIMTSPIGVLLVNTIENAIYLVMAVSDCDECGFNDLGKLMLVGVVLAVVVGIGLSLLHRRLKEKRAAGPEFVSIRPTHKD